MILHQTRRCSVPFLKKIQTISPITEVRYFTSSGSNDSNQTELKLPDPPKSIVAFRTYENNPANHNASHIGRFYTVPQEEYNIIYGPGVDSFSKQFRELFHTFRECSILVRSPFIDLKNCIEAYSWKLPTLKYLLYGPMGGGKSVTLNHLVHYGHKKNYVLFHVTWVPLWARFVKDFQPSTTRPGFFDHTTNAILWLNQFKIQNPAAITNPELVTSKKYEWSSRESTPAGSQILEIIDHGISRPIHASECIYALASELKLLSSQGKCKTMVLIDGANALYYESVRFKDSDRKLIPSSNITLYEAVKQFFKTDWNGGVVACTVDKYAIHSDYRTSDLPRHLLSQKGWEDFDPFVPIHVDKYSSKEIQTTIDYYLDRKWLTHPEAGSEKARKELEYLSVRNPYTLMELCAYR